MRREIKSIAGGSAALIGVAYVSNVFEDVFNEPSLGMISRTATALAIALPSLALMLVLVRKSWATPK